MEYDLILYERRGVAAWITLNAPEQHNAISGALIEELRDAVTRAEADLAVRAIVLTGSGASFCAGADLKSGRELQDAGVEASVRLLLRPLTDLLRAFRNSPLPIIAAVNGYCLAGGLETLLCCDLVIAAESATFGDQHAMFGLLPAIGGAQGLLRALGTFRAKEMMLTGARFSAQQMKDAGLVNVVSNDDALQASAQALADSFGGKSPEGIARMKQLLNNEGDMPWELAAAYELSHASAHLRGPDIAEGTKAFLEKREPKFERR